ncbi:MAG: DUF58 domain-containing protein [Acidobacteria bacterium]|nr:DUF58 domain-containing protein [Acidobacteriota bacterium]
MKNLPYLFGMLAFLRQKQSRRFVIVTASLTVAALLAALLAGLASQVGKYELAAHSSRVALLLALIVLVYAMPKLARGLSWRSKYAMHVPNAGLIFGAAILMVTVLALTSGNNLLYLVLAALLATMIVSVLSTRLNIRRLKPSVRYPDHIFAGESVSFEITLQNQKRLMPSFSLSVDLVEEHQTPNNESKPVEQRAVALAYFPLVPARSHARSRIERVFARRGVFPVTGFILNSGFPFGFVEQRRLIEWHSEIVVYPQPQPLNEFAGLLPMVAGRIENRAKGSGGDLYAIRQYLASDHHHHIDWKATAKTDQLMVREFTREDDWRITVRFDSRKGDPDLAEAEFAEQFERAVTFAASLLSHYIELGAEVRLVMADVDTGFGSGQKHLFAVLRQLAQAAPGEKEPADDDRPSAGIEILLTANGNGLAASPHTLSTHVITFEEMP